MNARDFADRFEGNAEIIRALMADVSDDEARWRPAEDRWSILETMTHMHDEEREDFRPRLENTLRDPSAKWSGIDPQGWVASREYQKRELAASLDGFLAERKRSVDWLREVSEPRFDNTYEHPLGPIRAGDLLASWLAHDHLHIRQLAGLRYEYVKAHVDPYSTQYSGGY